MYYNNTKLNKSEDLIYNHSTYNLSILNTTMQVQKRGNRGFEDVKLDKIVARIKALAGGLSVDPVKVSIDTIRNIYDKISTEELDKISAKISESFKLIHPDYGVLAGRLLISNLQKSTPGKFSECMRLIGKTLKIKSKKHYRFIEKYAAELDNMILHDNDYSFDYFGYKTLENAYLVKKKFQVYENGQKRNIEKIIDRPQYVWMRVAIAIYKDSDPDPRVCLENIKQCYKGLSQMYFTHATPTLFNSCTHNQQLNSCFLLGTGDSIEEIMRTLSNASFISKWAGGIGIWFHCIRAQNSYINGTNGNSSGLPKQLKMYNEAARTWDQGGKRLGAFAAYLEPWHKDIMTFLELKLQNGAETQRARDLFYALWVNDLFVKRLKEDADWSLFSEDTAPGLSDVYDGMEICSKCGFCQNRNYVKLMHENTKAEIAAKLEAEESDSEDDSEYDITASFQRKTNDGVEDEARFRQYNQKHAGCDHVYESRNVFTELYERYEREGRAMATIKARDVLESIMTMQRESGTPYIAFKDHVNRKSNQMNIGTIKSSNLCCEIMEWSSEYSYACCTLASINLKKFLIKINGIDGSTHYEIDHTKLHEVVRLVARNLDIIIDINKYPVVECFKNSRDFRPIGIGIQALADVFCEMRIPFISHEAARIDVEIMETIYHAALEESMERAKTKGAYSEFEGSPASRGLLQFDLWERDLKARNISIFDGTGLKSILSGRYDWGALKTLIVKHGLRNSLLVALMPTVSTSQIMGNNESFEPYAANIYTKTTLGGKFMVSNNAMIRHLVELGLWNESLKNRIITNDGSINGTDSQGNDLFPEIPARVKEVYKTVWELSQRELMRRAAIRGAFVDQSQSFNVHLRDNSNKYLRTVFLWAHDFGLKTGSYYIRSRAAVNVLKNNLSVVKQAEAPPPENEEQSDLSEAEICRRDAETGQKICEMCSS